MIAKIVGPLYRQRTFCPQYRFANFYKLVNVLENVSKLSDLKLKNQLFAELDKSLPQEQKADLDDFKSYMNSKPSFGISSKILVKNLVKIPEGFNAKQAETSYDWVKKITTNDSESSLTIYDIKLIFQYFTARTGTGSQKQKAGVLSALLENCSQLEGLYLMKMVDKKLTIGMSTATIAKTTTKARVKNATNTPESDKEMIDALELAFDGPESANKIDNKKTDEQQSQSQQTQVQQPQQTQVQQPQQTQTQQPQQTQAQQPQQTQTQQPQQTQKQDQLLSSQPKTEQKGQQQIQGKKMGQQNKKMQQSQQIHMQSERILQKNQSLLMEQGGIDFDDFVNIKYPHSDKNQSSGLSLKIKQSFCSDSFKQSMMALKLAMYQKSATKQQSQPEVDIMQFLSPKMSKASPLIRQIFKNFVGVGQELSNQTKRTRSPRRSPSSTPKASNYSSLYHIITKETLSKASPLLQQIFQPILLEVQKCSQEDFLQHQSTTPRKTIKKEPNLALDIVKQENLQKASPLVKQILTPMMNPNRTPSITSTRTRTAKSTQDKANPAHFFLTRQRLSKASEFARSILQPHANFEIAESGSYHPPLKSARTVKATLTPLELLARGEGVFSILTQQRISKASPLVQSLLIPLSDPYRKVETKSKTKIEEQQEHFNPAHHDSSNIQAMLGKALPSLGKMDTFLMRKKNKAPLILDVKYDGERTIIRFKREEGLTMTSRNQKPQDDKFPHLKSLISEDLMNSDIKSIILDGEIMLYEKSTGKPRPQQDIRKNSTRFHFDLFAQQQLSADLEMRVEVFDVLEYNGKDLLLEPLVERRKYIPQTNGLRMVSWARVHFPEQRQKILDYFTDTIEKGFEGLIIKSENDKYYTNNSRKYWGKMKRGIMHKSNTNVGNIDLDLVVMGANYGKGVHNTNILNSFLVGALYNDKIYAICKVAGIGSQVMNFIQARIRSQNLILEQPPENYVERTKNSASVYLKPELVFEVHSYELMRSSTYCLGDDDELGGISLKNPTFKRIRDDKDLNTATKGEEVLELRHWK